MAKKSVKIEVNNFIKGIITEASPLNFPENATLDESNFVLNRDGTRNRRLGMDFESGYSLVPATSSVNNIVTRDIVPFKWTNVAGKADDNFLVVQDGSKIHIFDMRRTAITGMPALAVLELSTYSFSASAKYSYAVVEGKLVIAAGKRNIVTVTHLAGVFTVEAKQLLVRDVWGVEVKEDSKFETDVQYRSATLHPSHNYNLYNQSWGTPRQSYLVSKPAESVGTGIELIPLAPTPTTTIDMADPVQVYVDSLGIYPSNSETVWPGLQFQPVSAGASPFERLFPELYKQTFGADIKTAKGSFIIDLLRRGASRSAAIASNAKRHSVMKLVSFDTSADYTTGGAAFVCEFAGRVFYAGFSGDVVDGDARSPSLSNYVMFSQLVRNTGDIVKCYQEGDPTSRESNDLVDTDGGFIRLSGAERIIGMLSLAGVLAVFASNGVWIISGGSDFGFTATNYKTDRISSFGALSRYSIVEDGTRAVYWSEDGIYAIGKDQFGSFNVENIAQKTIQSLYDEIPTLVKSKAIGVFDSIGKRIRWLYQIGNRFSSESETYELVLDMTIGAFYKLSIGKLSDYSTEVLAPFSSVPFTLEDDISEIQVGSSDVLSSTNEVISLSERRVSGMLDTRYLCAKISGGSVYFTVGFYRDETFTDWKASNGVGVDAPAFLITGATTGGDSSLVKQVPYLFAHFFRTEKLLDSEGNSVNPSSCLIQSQWDWSTARLSNKWSPQFQAYRYRRNSLTDSESLEYDSGFELVTSKNKLRGRGRSFALRMETEPLHDCQIVGWNISLNGNAIA